MPFCRESEGTEQGSQNVMFYLIATVNGTSKKGTCLKEKFSQELQWYSLLNASFSLSEALSKKAAAENMLGQLNNKVVDSESER